MISASLRSLSRVALMFPSNEGGQRNAIQVPLHGLNQEGFAKAY